MAKRKGQITTAKEAAWKEFSRYIRLRDSILSTNTIDRCVCVTCGESFPTFGVGCIQAGHAVPGRKPGILFDEKAVNGQCGGCNRRGGTQTEYTIWFVDTYGWDEYVKLAERKKMKHNWDVDTLDGIAYTYKEKVDALLRDFEQSNPTSEGN